MVDPLPVLCICFYQWDSLLSLFSYFQLWLFLVHLKSLYVQSPQRPPATPLFQHCSPSLGWQPSAGGSKVASGWTGSWWEQRWSSGQPVVLHLCGAGVVYPCLLRWTPNSVFVRTLPPLHWGQCIFSGTRNSWEMLLWKAGNNFFKIS